MDKVVCFGHSLDEIHGCGFVSHGMHILLFKSYDSQTKMCNLHDDITIMDKPLERSFHLMDDIENDDYLQLKFKITYGDCSFPISYGMINIVDFYLSTYGDVTDSVYSDNVTIPENVLPTFSEMLDYLHKEGRISDQKINIMWFSGNVVQH